MAIMHRSLEKALDILELLSTQTEGFTLTSISKKT